METILQSAKELGIILAQFILGIYFCKQYINKVADKIDISKGVKNQNEIDLDIIAKMDYYKELLNADRILLFEFHNGQHYSNYRSALRMSASYEVFRAGLSSCRDKCTGLPISIMPHFISTITSAGTASCKDIEEIKDKMGTSYEFKKSIGIKAFYDAAIRDRNGNIIGFAAVQWNHTLDQDFDTATIDKLVWYLEESVNRLMESDRKSKKRRLF